MNAEETSRKIYLETKDFYEARLHSNCRLGFKILYGPPIETPEILFVAYQPGGGTDDYSRELAMGAHVGWPRRCEYAYERWTLARRMQEMFDSQHLEKCVALNAIFVRSPSVECYKKSLSISLRREIEVYCALRLTKLVNALDPQKIVVIGFDTLDLLGGGSSDVVSPKGRTLTKLGSSWGRSVLGTFHLSGARISNTDRDLIRDRILAF